MVEKLVERFLAKVKKHEDGCWLWQGAKQDSAEWYNRVHGTKVRGPNWRGRFRIGKKVWLAHRASWVLFRGEIEPECVVAHECDTGLCVNPDHLFLATIQENIEDMKEKRRAGKK